VAAERYYRVTTICPAHEETLDVVEGMRRGLRRVRRQDLAFSFLTHAGLSF
jgi:hypothetical protein